MTRKKAKTKTKANSTRAKSAASKAVAKHHHHHHHKRGGHTELMGVKVHHVQAQDALKHTAAQLGLLLAGGALGAFFGRSSLYLSIPGIFVGNYKKNAHITSAAMGMALGGVIRMAVAPPSAQAVPAVNGMEGFDAKTFIADGKERVTAFLHSLADSLYIIPQAAPAASSLKGLGEPDVTYFRNPYSQMNGTIDMSALDRLSEQVALLANSGAPPSYQSASQQDQVQGTDEMQILGVDERVDGTYTLTEDVSGTLADLADFAEPEPNF